MREAVGTSRAKLRVVRGRRSCVSLKLRVDDVEKKVQRCVSRLVVTILVGEEVNSDMQSACGDESS